MRRLDDNQRLESYDPGMIRGFVLVSIFCWISVVGAQPATVPATQPMSREEILIAARAELGSAFQPADAEKLLAAHDAIERYFAATSTADRTAAIAAISETSLGADVVGRLCRIRRNWQSLSGGVYYINEKIGPSPVHYFLGIPAGYDRLKPWPLVVRLPIAKPFVTDPRPDADEVTRIYTNWLLDEVKAHPDAIVLMPLLNLDELYGPSYAGMNSVIKPILHTADRVNIDPSRVYLTGQTMSAHSVWNLALHYPTYFAAINPMAGAASADWQRLRLMNLRNLLCVAWHDVNDPVIKVDSSRQIVNNLRRFKVDVQYEETKQIGNEPTDEILSRCYQQMRERSRKLYPTQISLQSNRLDTIFNRIDWLQVYQPLNIGEDKRLLFRRGSGAMLIQTTVWSADAKRDGNRFEIDAKNVEVLRLYVNDRMIDFAKPVNVIVNRRPRFEGLVQPDLKEMMEDQLFLGRGWRHFSGVIDVDLAEKARE